MTKSENARDYESLFWNDGATLVVCEEPDEKRVYDLEERTARFGEAIIDFAKTIPQSAVTYRIVGQLIGAATSVGANYVEADDAVSKKVFLKNIGTCRKEAPETRHFLRMAVRAVPELKPQARKLWAEAKEIAPHFLENLEKWKMMLFIRASSLLRHSSFVIRHFPYA